LGTLILYSPSAQAPFLCLEPVSHPVDAHNLPGQPGLVRLAQGESLSAFLALSWDVPTRGEPARDKAPRP
jgi:aldose 1-epimerase